MSHQIWHAFYYDRVGDHAPPCRSEVIQAANEEAAAKVARAHLGDCKRATLEAASWMERVSRVIYAEDGERRRAYLH
jgi:protein subunit release factor A